MLQSPALPTFSASTGPLSSIDTSLLIVPVFEEDPLDDLPDLDAASGGHVRRAQAAGEVQGKLYELFFTPISGWAAPRIALIGAGKRDAWTMERLRRCAAAAALAARHRRIGRIAWVIRGSFDLAAAAQASVEGLGIAAFHADRYKSRERGPEGPREVVVVASADGDTATLEQAVRRGTILAESSNLARELCNEPPNVLTPQTFAERASAIGHEVGLEVDILDEQALGAHKMGLLLGVGQGSVNPPRLIALTYTPPAAPPEPVLGLVGKGITFDTGGISIKPAEGMDRMKDDMAGGAAVICAMRAIALLKPPIKVVGIVPTAENMPGGRAIKPGDLLTGASGITVEVINTDAEGRLILGDGLWYAQHRGATHLVDVATLTGACVIALGKAAAGLFGQPDPWVDIVRETAQRAGDRVWPMPLFEEYADQLKSEIADMINSGGRPAGACTAAMFLKEFAGGRPWVHLDIAGTAWVDDAKPWQPKGVTAPMVRTLAELPFTAERWR